MDMRLDLNTAALLLITGILVVLLVAVAYDNLVSLDATTDRTKPEVNWTKQDDKALMDLNAARGCVITEDVGRTILWKCPGG